MPRPLPQNKGGNKENESPSRLLGRQIWVLGVGKTIVFDGKMGILKFGSAALPFSKVAYIVKGLRVYYNGYLREIKYLKGLPVNIESYYIT